MHPYSRLKHLLCDLLPIETSGRNVLPHRLSETASLFPIPLPAEPLPTEAGLSLFGVLKQADPALIDPGVTAQLECLLDDVVVGKQEMVGAIDAVCCVAERIIGKLTKSAGTIQKTAREIGLRRYDRPPATVVSARMQR